MKLRHVSPVRPSNDSRYGYLANPIASGEVSLEYSAKRVESSDLGNHLVRQFSVAEHLPLCLTVLADLVPAIVGLGPEEKMIWSDASCDIAMMKHAKPLWDRAVRSLPGVTVSSNADAGGSDVPVPVRVSRTCPKPAVRAVVHMPSEALFDGYSTPMAQAAAISSARFAGGEGLIAVRAGKLEGHRSHSFGVWGGVFKHDRPLHFTRCGG